MSELFLRAVGPDALFAVVPVNAAAVAGWRDRVLWSEEVHRCGVLGKSYGFGHVVGFAGMYYDSPSVRFVRGGALQQVVTASLAGVDQEYGSYFLDKDGRFRSAEWDTIPVHAPRMFASNAGVWWEAQREDSESVLRSALVPAYVLGEDKLQRILEEA